MDLDNFKIEGPYAWVVDSNVALITGFAYVAVIFAYKQWFEPPMPPPGTKAPKRKIARWVKPLAVVHNFFLAGLSLAMFVGMGTSFWAVCEKHGFETCLDVHRTGKEELALFQGRTGFWIWLFDASKYYELLDTLFMMFKGYQLIVLHWWHHATVPFLCTVHAMERTSTAWTGSIFNCFVHVIMYTYYGLSAAGIAVPGKTLITGLQIVQFCVVLGHLSSLWMVHSWTLFPGTIISGYTIYVSYLLLFIKFYIETYCCKGKKKSDSSSGKGKTNGVTNGHDNHNGHTNGVNGKANGVNGKASPNGKTSQKKKSQKAE